MIKNILIGNTNAIRAYLGDILVWDSFDPLTLFAGGKQGVWYDPSDKSTLFQDVAGTVPVTKDGDPVALMKDKSGNDNHAVQTVSTSRPIYKTDGVLHWLYFDGVDDGLSMPTLNYTGGSQDLYMGVNVDFSSNRAHVFFSRYSEKRTLLVYLFGTTLNHFTNAGDFGTVGGFTKGVGTVLVARNSLLENKKIVKIPSSNTIISTTYDASVSSSTTMMMLGRAESGYDSPLKGLVYSVIFVYGSDLNSKVAETEKYVATKSGVTL